MESLKLILQNIKTDLLLFKLGNSEEKMLPLCSKPIMWLKHFSLLFVCLPVFVLQLVER